MKWLWGLLGRQAEWLQNVLDTELQQRIALLCIYISIPLALYGPFSDEQLVIYEMSAAALTLTGLGWLSSLQAKRAVEDSD